MAIQNIQPNVGSRSTSATKRKIDEIWPKQDSEDLIQFYNVKRCPVVNTYTM